MYVEYVSDADKVFSMDKTGISTVPVRIILCHTSLN